jgi:hypothetical protein
MYETLFTYFERVFPLSDQEKEIIRSVVLPKKLKKGEFLQQEGEWTRYGAFVTHGCSSKEIALSVVMNK